jgi:hypothetical protein
MCLLPNSSLLSLWFIRFVNLVLAAYTPFLTSISAAARPFEAFGVLIEEVSVDSTMAILVPVVPGTAIPIDFEFACISLAPSHYCMKIHVEGHTIMILTTILVVIKNIKLFLAMLTHSIALSFYTGICGWCMFMLIRKIDNGGRCSEQLFFDQSTRFI